MKKYIILAYLIIGICFVSKSQDCKDVERKIDEMKGDTTFFSPNMNGVNKLFMFKDGHGELKVVGIVFETTNLDANYDAHGIYIKFDDGTFLRYPGRPINCTYLNSDDHYKFEGSLSIDLHMTPQDLEFFKTKKVVKFMLADKEVNVDDKFAVKFRNAVNCILAMN